MRRGALLLAAALGLAACFGSRTTLTLRVDVPAGPPITADFLGVMLTPFGDGKAELIYELPEDRPLDDRVQTLVVILASVPPGSVDIVVDARRLVLDADGGPPVSVSLATGAASATFVRDRNTDVTVHLAPPP